MSDALPPPPDASKSYAGTCQVCFRHQVTKARQDSPALLLVLHGYNRPGHGYIVGDCPGRGSLPYELSCEVTRSVRNGLTRQLANIRSYLADLRAGRVDELRVKQVDEEKTQENRRNRVFRTEYKDVVVARGYKEYVPSEGLRTWDMYLASAIRHAEGEEQRTEHGVRFLTEKVDSWKYAPGDLVEHETWVREGARRTKEEREAAREQRARERFCRNWALAWKYVGQAVNRHAKGLRCANEYCREEADAVRIGLNWLPAFSEMYPGVSAKRRRKA